MYMILPVYAQGQFEFVPDPVADSPTTTNLASWSSIAAIILNVMMGVSLTAGFISIIVSGVQFMMAQGDWKALATAKRSLTYAVIGFIVAASAFTLKFLILRIFSGSYEDVTDITV